MSLMANILARPTSDRAPSAADRAPIAAAARRLVRAPTGWVLAAIALAVLSWATLPTIPSYDPYSWIIWGREVSDPHLAFEVFGGPSWKPLPFAFTAVYGVFAGAAPTLWVITARAAGLLGLAVAWRLARRLGGGGRWGAVAGLIAVCGIVLTYDWPYDFLRGTSEPMLVACTLWPIDRLWHGRRGQAFWLVVAAALLRPEAWPFLGADAVWLWLRDPEWAGWRPRAGLLAGLVLVALGWLGPPWLGSAGPLLAAHNAALYNGMLGADPLWTELGRLVGIQTWPLLLGALALVWLGVVTDRDRRLRLALAAGVVIWWAIVIVMTVALGYPGLERFYLPAASVVCVLGAAGIVALARLGGGWLAGRWLGGRGRSGDRGGVGTVATVGVLMVLLAATSVGSLRPISVLGQFEPEAALAVSTVRGLDRAVRVAGGRRAVLPCARSFVAVNHAAQPALAWDLRTGLPSVGTAMSRPGIDFIGPANRATGIPAAIAPDLLHDRLLARSGAWSVYALTRRARPHGARCL
jgi:hypothetical protein